ncbi:hypothetical protein ACV3UL_15595 [Clostridium perfringens]
MKLYSIKLTDIQFKDLRTLLIKQMANENNYMLFSENEEEFENSIDGYLRLSLVCEKLRILKLNGEKEFKLNCYEMFIIQYMFETMYTDCEYHEKYFRVPLERVDDLYDVFSAIKLSAECWEMDRHYAFECNLAEKIERLLKDCTIR